MILPSNRVFVGHLGVGFLMCSKTNFSWLVVAIITLCLSVSSGAGQLCFPAVLIDTASNDPYAMCAAQFNHDDEIDLAVVNFLDQNVTIFLNQGGGALSQPYQTPVNGGPISVLAADLIGALLEINSGEFRERKSVV